MNKRILVIIPARGGSKGIPRKNLQILLGKSLLQRTCELALSLNSVSEVVCSSEDPEILQMAQSYGVATPFQRPESLALDNSTTADVIVHALNEMERIGKAFDFFILLEVTSQLTRNFDVELGLKYLLENNNFDSLITITKSESGHPIFTFLFDSETNAVKPYLNEPWRAVRRQEIDPLYFIEGSFYISKVESFLRHKSFVHNKTMGFIVPKWQSFEIDDPLDLVIVEAIMKEMVMKGEFPSA